MPVVAERKRPEKELRWSVRRKTDAVVPLLRGEDIDTLARELRVEAHRLAAWRDEFVAAGSEGLKARPNTPLAALRRAKAVHETVRFDLVHHLTFANVTTGALMSLLPIPFVWGPVGGGVRVPWRLARVGGARGLAYEALRAWRRAVARYLDPLVRLTWRRAELILVQNLDTLRWLPSRLARRAWFGPTQGSTLPTWSSAGGHRRQETRLSQ
jgi:hypothetical protein